jgi:hypothetical protein
MGGKTKNSSGVVVCRSRTPAQLRPIHQPLQADLAAAELAAQPKLNWRTGEIFPRIRLDRFVPVELQTFWATLGDGALPPEQRQEQLEHFFSSSSSPRSSAAVIEAFRHGVLSRFRDAVDQYDHQVSPEAQRLLEDCRQYLHQWSRDLEAGQLDAQAVQKQVAALRQEIETIGGTNQIARQSERDASTDRLCEALNTGLFALGLLSEAKIDINSALVGFLSDFELKINDRDPQYRFTHADDQNSFYFSEPDVQALQPYWQLFSEACQRP